MNPQQDACSGLRTRDARTSATPNLPAQLPPSIPTRFIQNLSEVEYPEGIKSPKAGLNANVTNGRFRYDRDFLMQFMHICKEKPLTLHPLDVLGIAPIDPSSFAMVRGGHGRHRNPSTAMAPSANRQASMGKFQSTGSKLTSEERFALSSAWSNANGNGGKRTRSKRGAKHGGSDEATLSKQEQGSAFESSCIVPPGTDLEPVAPIEMLVFEKAADEVTCSEMYARLCRKMMEQINPDMQDDRIKDQQGEPISEDFQRGWFRKQPTNAANEKKGMREAVVYSDESDAAQIAKRRCLGLVKFIGEMFMLQMVAEYIIHEFDVIELRERRWGSCDAVAARATIAAVHEAVRWIDIFSQSYFIDADVTECQDITAAEKVSYNCHASTSRSGSRRDGERNREFGPDSWAAQAAQFHGHLNPKAGDLSQFSKISKGAPMVMGPGSVFMGGIKDSNRESWSGKSSSSNMFHMLSQNPVLTHESSSTDIDLGQAGVPEPPIRRKKLQLIPRPKPTAEENTTAPSLDQNPEALALRKKLQLLPRFKPSVVARMPADIK
ncbi:hypothetical protein M405DRAFT_859725 [Rhizopogon salebrosus TDB-379]|nr:hypothetical protein M405DRAFT_859725 [Rhizopogon salebrosus TDB-379]